MSRTTQYVDNDLLGPSVDIWSDMKVSLIQEDPNLGYGHYDDFTTAPQVVAGVDTGGSPYKFYGDTGVTIEGFVKGGPSGETGGLIEVDDMDTDNDESVMSTTCPAFVVSDTAGAEKKLAFEARVARTTITNNDIAMFIGLAWDNGSTESVARTLCLTDDDANLGAFSYIGFHVDQADGDAIDFVVKAEGQAQTVIKAGIAVPVANAFNKLGFKFDPQAPPEKRIALFVDGVEQTTYVTATQIAAATFPDAEQLAMVWCAKDGSGSDERAQMSWWRCYQLR